MKSPFLRRFGMKSPFVDNETAVAAGFSPSTLFALAEPGVWLDPSDLTTMFQDAAGTTPVTAPGDLVGLRLDKSKGLTLGAELVVNGTFDSGITGWTPSGGTTLTNVSGQLQVVTSGAGNGVSQAVPTPAGVRYKVSVTVTSATVNYGIGWGSAFAQGGTYYTGVVSGTKTYTFIFAGHASFQTLWIFLPNAGTVVVDNISVRELPGNHATAPTDAARPMYGVEPKGGRRNLLLATDTLATQSLTVAAVAHTLAFTGTGTVTLSGASTAGPLVGTGAGNRVILTFTPTAASLTLTVSGSVTFGQLQPGSSDTPYQRVTIAEDVTEAGVPTCHYLRYDGSNSCMSTAAINFTGTNKMSVFAGVQKLSDATAACVAELGINISINNGTFALFAPGTNGAADYYSGVRGTALQNLQTATMFPAPITNVITILGDIPGSLSTLRANGTQAAQSTANAGTGNFGNYPLFIGRRNNATFSFNGRDYGIIIVGKTASAGEITDTETWLAARTAQVTL